MRTLLLVIALLLDCMTAPVALLIQLPGAVADLVIYSVTEMRYAITGVRTSIEDGLPYIEVEYSYVGA